MASTKTPLPGAFCITCTVLHSEPPQEPRPSWPGLPSPHGAGLSNPGPQIPPPPAQLLCTFLQGHKSSHKERVLHQRTSCQLTRGRDKRGWVCRVRGV